MNSHPKSSGESAWSSTEQEWLGSLFSLKPTWVHKAASSSKGLHFNQRIPQQAGSITLPYLDVIPHFITLHLVVPHSTFCFPLWSAPDLLGFPIFRGVESIYFWLRSTVLETTVKLGFSVELVKLCKPCGWSVFSLWGTLASLWLLGSS